ncbi:MAG: tetratricopeptide repeat protein [Candidatus Poribacteria bacterium]|nr:tetratricopeptide repeat protein [Candidatus Poribacteria bacterium]
MTILYKWRALLLIIALTFYFTACGPKAIPYSQNTDAPEPNAVAVAHYNWGMTSAQNGNFDQAIMELHLAIQNEPGWVMPFFTLGVVYGNQGELDKAIQVWERATQLDADFAKAHYNLAVAYLHKEEKTRSIASLRKAIRIDKEALSSAKVDPALEGIRSTPEFQELEHTAEEKNQQN